MDDALVHRMASALLAAIQAQIGEKLSVAGSWNSPSERTVEVSGEIDLLALARAAFAAAEREQDQ